MVMMCLVAGSALTAPQPVLIPIKSDDAAQAPGWIDECLWVDYTTTTNDSFLQPRADTNRSDVVWTGDNRASSPWMTEESSYGPYLKMDTESLHRYAARRVHAVHALTVLGVRLYQSNDLVRSLACFEEINQMDPDNQRAAELYSAIVVKAGEPGVARRVVRGLLDRFPANELIRFNLACACALEGDTDAALSHILYLARINWPELLYHLGDPDLASAHHDQRFRELEKRLLDQRRELAIETFRAQMFAPEM